MDQFHMHYPILHTPSFQVECAPIDLSLAVLAIGAQYCFDWRLGLSLYNAAKLAFNNKLHLNEATQPLHSMPEGTIE